MKVTVLPLLCVLGLLKSSLALPAATSPLPTAQSVEFNPKFCLYHGCPVEASPVWDPVLKKCTCKLSGPFNTASSPRTAAAAAVLLERDAEPDVYAVGPTPPKTNASTLTSTSKPKTTTTTSTSVPKPKPTISPCAHILCPLDRFPTLDPRTRICTCPPRPGPILPCTDIMCIAEQRPVRDAVTGQCGCQWIPGLEPGGGPTQKRESISEPKDAAIEAREAAPYSTPKGPACPGLFCIAEKRAVYNATTKTCSCKWIPGLEPAAASSSSKRDEEGSSAATSSPLQAARPIEARSRVCTGMACIAEMEVVYNATTQRCGCQWIPGFGPGGSADGVKRAAGDPGGAEGSNGSSSSSSSSSSSGSPATSTPAARETGPATEAAVRSQCESLKIYCRGGDHHMHLDAVTKTCKCASVVGPVRPVETAPGAQCGDYLAVCGGVAGHLLRWNPVTRECECPPSGQSTE